MNVYCHVYQQVWEMSSPVHSMDLESGSAVEVRLYYPLARSGQACDEQAHPNSYSKQFISQLPGPAPGSALAEYCGVSILVD